MGKSKFEHMKCVLEEPQLEQFYSSIKHKYNYMIIYDIFVKIQCNILMDPDYVVLDPAFIPTINILKSMGVQNFTATTGFNWEMTSILLNTVENQGLQLDKIITSDTVKNPRPHPDGINHIINKYKTTPQQCVKVGDTIVDIIEAKNASVHSVGITSNLKPLELLIGGSDYVIHSLRELPYVVAKINSCL